MQIQKAKKKKTSEYEQANMEYLAYDFARMQSDFAWHLSSQFRIALKKNKIKRNYYILQDWTAGMMSNFFANLKQVEISNFLRLPDRLISMPGPLFGLLFIRSGPLSYGGDMCHPHTTQSYLEVIHIKDICMKNVTWIIINLK